LREKKIGEYPLPKLKLAPIAFSRPGQAIWAGASFPLGDDLYYQNPRPPALRGSCPPKRSWPSVTSSQSKHANWPSQLPLSSQNKKQCITFSRPKRAIVEVGIRKMANCSDKPSWPGPASPGRGGGYRECGMFVNDALLWSCVLLLQMPRISIHEGRSGIAITKCIRQGLSETAPTF